MKTTNSSHYIPNAAISPAVFYLDLKREEWRRHNFKSPMMQGLMSTLV